MSDTGVKILVAAIILVVVIISAPIWAPILSSIFDFTSDEAIYSNGDRNLDHGIGDTVPIGTNADGTINCDGSGNNDSTLCGTDKFTAVTPVQTIMPILIAVYVLAVLVWWGVDSYRHGMNKYILIPGLISAAITGVIWRIVIPITFTPLEEAILAAYEGGFTAAVPLLKLVPLTLVVGSPSVGAVLTSIVGKREHSITGA